MMSDEKERIETDYDYSRQTYYDLLESGKESVEMMVEVARESEHPRAFEVLSNMIKNLADVNDKLMDLNKKNKDIHKAEKEETKQITNNNVFLGSAADLQRMLKDEAVIDVTPTDDAE